jgi:hypothetical protein
VLFISLKKVLFGPHYLKGEVKSDRSISYTCENRMMKPAKIVSERGKGGQERE